MKPARLLATIVLFLIAVGHLLRLVFHVEAIVGGFIVPMWMSVVACLFMGGLAVMLLMENRR
jgi:hypothetical protein